MVSPDVESEAEQGVGGGLRRRCRTDDTAEREKNANSPFQRAAGVVLQGWFSRGIIHFRRTRFLTVWLPSPTPSDTL